MKHAPIRAAAAMISLIALSACASRPESAAIESLRQQQIDDLTQLVRDHEFIVEEQHARAAQGLSQQYEIRSAQIDLARVKADLAKAKGDRDAWIAQLRESLAMTEELVARQEADARDPNTVDMNPTTAFEARESLVTLRQQLIDALQAE